MPRKNKAAGISKRSRAKVTSHVAPRQGITVYAKKSYKWAESYTSLLMGVVVIIVAVLFAVSLIRQTHHIQETSSTSIGPSTVLSPVVSPKPAMAIESKTYTVQSGDDLWHISEKIYGSGYNWVDIAKANNLSDPGMIFSGDKLTLPNVAVKTIVSGQSPPQSALGQITKQQDTTGVATDKTYTVQPGDDLWNIALHEYADGYRWVDIAKANNLANPDIIHSGNVFIIPR